MNVAAPCHNLPPRPVTRPVKKRCHMPLGATSRRTNFDTDNQRRLALLAGERCPNCGTLCFFDGRRLQCANDTDCLHGWSNAESAEDEIYEGLT